MTKPVIVGIAPQIVVRDAAATARYYQDVPGFTLIGLFPAETGSAYVMLERDGFQIHFGGAENAEMHINDRIRCGSLIFNLGA